MMTFKDHPFMIDRRNGVISIWNDETNSYQENTPEFIEDLYFLVKKAQQAMWEGTSLPEGIIYKP